MTEASIVQYIGEAFAGAETVEAEGNFFFFSGADRKLPFATLVTRDDYDSVSNLSRPSVFRVNIGLSKATCLSLFGAQSSASDAGSAKGDNLGDDFTALDLIMPHPVYGQMHWICVLNPSAKTFEKVRPLLAEAFNLASRRGEKIEA